MRATEQKKKINKREEREREREREKGKEEAMRAGTRNKEFYTSL